MTDLRLTKMLIEAQCVAEALEQLRRLRFIWIYRDLEGVERVRILPQGKRELRACAAAKVREPHPRAHPSSTPSKGIGARSRAPQP